MDVFPYGQIAINRTLEPQPQIPIHTTSFEEPQTQSTPQLVFKPSITVVGTNSGEIKVEQEEDTTSQPQMTNPIVFKENIEQTSEKEPASTPAPVDSALNLTNDFIVVKKS